MITHLPIPVVVWEYTPELTHLIVSEANTCARQMLGFAPGLRIDTGTSALGDIFLGQAQTSLEKQAPVARMLSLRHLTLEHVLTQTPTGSLVSTFTNVTRYAQEARDLKESNDILELFASNVAHDLREPLRMVSQWVFALEEDYAEKLSEPAAKEMLNYILEGTSRMNRLIDSMLEYARAGTHIEPVSTAIGDVLGTALENLASKIVETHASIETPAGSEKVYGDPQLLAQVFQNVIFNSLTFQPPDQAPEICITTESTEDFLHIAIRDNGVGVAKDRLGEVFGFMRRLHRRTDYPGSGIGLSIVQRLVRAHKGAVRFESEGEGKGSTVTITLPHKHGPR